MPHHPRQPPLPGSYPRVRGWGATGAFSASGRHLLPTGTGVGCRTLPGRGRRPAPTHGYGGGVTGATRAWIQCPSYPRVRGWGEATRAVSSTPWTPTHGYGGGVRGGQAGPDDGDSYPRVRGWGAACVPLERVVALLPTGTGVGRMPTAWWTCRPPSAHGYGDGARGAPPASLSAPLLSTGTGVGRRRRQGSNPDSPSTHGYGGRAQRPVAGASPVCFYPRVRGWGCL